ncbi:hypothetical protein BASA81_002768 [Batrachochytrium salamandrivorans]|nr:hypothetical protein BASA81_002768 [Batrachochytrium salamandrivorans]
MNQNVKVTLFASCTVAISETSWGYSALSGYLFDIGHDNTHVGIAEASQGICQLIAAMVAGRMADKKSRQLPLRIGVFVGFVAIFVLWLAMYSPYATSSDTHAFWMSTLGLGVWGLFRGATMAPLDALFADSIATHERAKLQVWKYVATLVGATNGPILASLLFLQVGDSWTRSELKYVIAAGTGFAAVPLVSLLFLRDKHSLGEELSGPLMGLNSNHNPQDDDEDDDAGATGEEEEGPSAHELLASKVRQLCFGADALFGVASGMTVKFFPLFFRDNTHLTPAKVNMVTIVTTFLMIFGSLLAQKLAVRSSRMKVILIFKFIGIALLFIMAQFQSLWSDWRIIVPIYVARTVLMNATAPLHKSILMDHCPKSTRGRWNAADSIVTFGWSGSAFLGGILADAHGFGFSFLITAALQFVGFLLLFALVPLVRDEPAPAKPVVLAEEGEEAV